MSERVKLADAEVLSALASTDYLLAERNGAIGRAAMGDYTFLTAYDRVVLDNMQKASGVNLVQCADFGDGLASAWTLNGWSLSADTLDGEGVMEIDLASITGSFANLAQNVTPETGTWHAFSFWSRGADFYSYVIYACDTSTQGWVDGIATAFTSANTGVSWAADNEWTRHVVAFRTSSAYSGQVQVQFRAFPGSGTLQVSMPKFERGPVATPWGGLIDDCLVPVCGAWLAAA